MKTSSSPQPAPGPKVLRSLEAALLAVSGACILLIGSLISVGIFTRALFGWSLPDVEVMVRELMIGSIILPLAYVTADRAHISVEVFTNFMPRRFDPWLDLLSSVIGFLVLLPIVYGGYIALAATIAEDTYFFGQLELPEWPGRLAFFLGYLLFVVRLAWLIGHDALRAFAGSSDSSAQDNLPPSGPTE
ncbi:TRAP transporter small permease [Rhodovibrionaceae bacterium A322]